MSKEHIHLDSNELVEGEQSPKINSSSIKKENESDIYIVGTGGFAREVVGYILDSTEYAIAGYFDTCTGAESFFQPFLGSENSFNFRAGDKAVVVIADYKIRSRIYSALARKGVQFPTIIHNTCVVSPFSEIGNGSILCPFVTVTSNAVIGENFQANIYSYIAHDCRIGSNVTFAPAVKCNGNVVVEDNVYIGTGAIIFQGKAGRPLVIGEGAVIAAGSVVTKSVPPGMTVFGNPAIDFTKENIKRRS